MDILLYLIPIALLLGGAGLVAFLWSLKSGQFEDMEGAANRILFDDEDTPQHRPSDPENPHGKEKKESPRKTSIPD